MKNWRASLFLTALAFLLACGTTALSEPADGSAPAATASSNPMASSAAADSPAAPVVDKAPLEKATPPGGFGTDTYVLWQDKVQACIKQGGPIGIDEYFMAISDLAKTGDTTIVRHLRDFMTCRQLADTSQDRCSADAVMVEPFFTESEGNPQARELTKRESDKAEELISQAEKGCAFDNFTAAFIRGEKDFLGKPLAPNICSGATEMPEKASIAECEKSVNAFIAAVEKDDPAMCDAVGIAMFRDVCKLFTTRDVNVCNSASFKSAPIEQCQNRLTTFKILKNIPLDKDEKIKFQADAFLAVAVKYAEDKNYCDAIYRNKLLPAYCHGINVKDLNELIEQQKKNEASQKYYMEETERIRKEREAKAKEDKEKEEKTKGQGGDSGGTTDTMEMQKDGGN